MNQPIESLAQLLQFRRVADAYCFAINQEAIERAFSALDDPGESETAQEIHP